MKISKIFTGLIVCSALIFPGALSSSAQEIDSSISVELDNPTVPVESLNYSPEQEAELSTHNEFSRQVAESINVGRYWYGNQGSYFLYSMTLPQPAPYAPRLYSGYVFYDYSQSNILSNLFWYEGTLFLR